MKKLHKRFGFQDDSGKYIDMDETTKQNLMKIVLSTNAFLAEPLTLEQCREFIGSIIDFYFSHSDNLEEFEDFIDYMASFLELFADNIQRRCTNETAE